MGLVYFLAFVFFLIQLSWADIVNRTTDDSLGDSATHVLVTYLPTNGVWNNEKCTTCSIQPDISQTFSGTYTAATHNPGDQPISITIDFTGIALWVYFTLANNVSGAVTKTAVNFTLDGGTPVFYNHEPDLATTDFNYKAPVYQHDSLDNIHHTLVISTSQAFPDPVYVNFDYAIYTHEDVTTSSTGSTTTFASPPTSPGPSNAPSIITTPISQHKDSIVKRAVIGGVLGGVGATLALLLAFYCCMQWRRRSSRIADEKNILEAPTPYVDSRPTSSHTDTFTPFSTHQQRGAPPALFLREKDSASLLRHGVGLTPTSPPAENDGGSMYTRRRVVFAPGHSRVTSSIDDDPQGRSPAHTARLLRQLHQEFVDLAAELGESAHDMAKHLMARPGGMQDPDLRQFIDTSEMREQLLMIQARIENIEAGQSPEETLRIRPPEYSSEWASPTIS